MSNRDHPEEYFDALDECSKENARLKAAFKQAQEAKNRAQEVIDVMDGTILAAERQAAAYREAGLALLKHLDAEAGGCMDCRAARAVLESAKTEEPTT